MKRPRPRMKRLILLLLAYAGGGAIINVAVAWAGLLMPLPIEKGRLESIEEQGHVESIEMDSRCREWLPNGWEKIYFGDWEFGGSTLFTTHFKRSPPTAKYIVILTQGWPTRSTRGFEFLEPEVQRRWRCCIPVQLCRTDRFVYITLLPIWPGFAINMIFYAAILWLLFAALHPGGFVRRRIRARRGQCPACAYPVGSSTVCTECGRPLKSVDLEALL